MVERCPHCGSSKIQENRCTHCDKDIAWVGVIAIKSKSCYEKAYAYAKERDLSGARILLVKAVALDKYNIEARNLLGLILFELGEVGEALKQWIISDALKKEDNIAKEYIARIQKQVKKFENYKDAIGLYNKALKYFSHQNEDVAFIRLKKAIQLMPEFVEARNLLAAYYLNNKQEEKAMEQIREVLAIDRKNIKALTYLKVIHSIDTEEVASIPKKVHIPSPHLDQRVASKPSKVINRGHTLGKAVGYFIVGALCMFAIQMGLILPTKTESMQLALEKALTTAQEVEAKLKDTTEENNKKLMTLEEQNKKLKQQNEEIQLNNNKLLQKERIQSVNTLKKDRKWVEAAEILYNISVNDLDEINKTLYEELKIEVFKNAANELYSVGYIGYKNAKYNEAKSYFEKVVLYVPGTRVAADALYYMAQSEEATQNIEKAKQYYNTLITDYAGTNAAYKAKQNLAE